MTETLSTQTTRPAGAGAATRDALEVACRLTDVHARAESVPVPHGRVGQVVATSAGLFVVESVLDVVSRHDLDTALVAARLVAAELGRLGWAAPVRPVIAVWGPDADQVPLGGAEVEGALIISGSELVSFLGWSGEVGSTWSATTATRALRSLVRGR